MDAKARRMLDLAAVAGIGLLTFFLTGIPVHDDLLVFQLGPNDHRYLEGFAPHYEVENGVVGTRWTTYHARIDLPLVLEGPAEVIYRFSRVFGETAEAEITLGGSTVDRFNARGIDVDSHERRNLGLKLDWVAVALGPEARLRLRGNARLLPALLAAFLFALFQWGGLGLRGSLASSLVFVGVVVSTMHHDIFGLAHV